MSGKLIILSAPSGAGKSTIIKYLLQKDYKLEFSVSACNREKRKGEKDGVDYYFLTTEEFKNKIKKDEFLEYEEVYKDLFYGTLKTEVERITQKGNNVIFDVDIAGGLNIKKQYGNRALAIFIMPPSIEELRKRLTLRSTESEEEIKQRIDKAETEMKYAKKFDKIIVNDNLETALEEADKIVGEFLKSSKQKTEFSSQ
jgi:guanylate kinase